MDEVKQRLFNKINQMRQQKGRNPFQYDNRLEKAAQDMANMLTRGSSPHARLRQRIEESGFPISNDKCLITRESMQANYTEGILNTQDPELDEKAPPELVAGGPGEAHYEDFYDPLITYVGIGTAIGRTWKYMVLDYGRICPDLPDPHPGPTPTPTPIPPDPPPLPESFFDMVKKWLKKLFGRKVQFSRV